MTKQKSTHKTRLLEWFKTIEKETIAAPTRYNTNAYVTKYTLK